ncbi:MAG: M15 family metallopeptidase [Nanobdellota archaeon]
MKMENIIPDDMLESDIHDNGESFTQLYPNHRIITHPCYIRSSVRSKLDKAISALPEAYSLVILDAYRPLAIQKKMFTECMIEMQRIHPPKLAYQKASLFVAPPNIAPHCTGGAVDVTLAYNGKPLDMGSDYRTNTPASYSVSHHISVQAANNRSILFQTMLEAGFVNYPSEWWHWSYGDSYWAAVNKTKTLYDRK